MTDLVAGVGKSCTETLHEPANGADRALPQALWRRAGPDLPRGDGAGRVTNVFFSAGGLDPPTGGTFTERPHDASVEFASCRRARTTPTCARLATTLTLSRRAGWIAAARSRRWVAWQERRAVEVLREETGHRGDGVMVAGASCFAAVERDRSDRLSR